MNYKYYAKSNPIETIKEHTDKLLENLEILKITYGAKIVQVIDMSEDRFWQLMEIICKYHDVGKVYSGFQNVIRKAIGEPLLATKFNNEQIKHEQISPMFVPYKEYGLTKTERKLIYQAIYYHHERDNIIHMDEQLLNEIINFDNSIKNKNYNFYIEVLSEGKGLGEKKLCMVVDLLRKSKFKLYLPMMKFLR